MHVQNKKERDKILHFDELESSSDVNPEEGDFELNSE